jgi:hypothetical protein
MFSGTVLRPAGLGSGQDDRCFKTQAEAIRLGRRAENDIWEIAIE